LKTLYTTGKEPITFKPGMHASEVGVAIRLQVCVFVYVVLSVYVLCMFVGLRVFVCAFVCMCVVKNPIIVCGKEPHHI